MFDQVILHIGSTKTGTSAIQSGLVRHRDDLKARGFCYMPAVTDDHARKGIVTPGNAVRLLNLLRAGTQSEFDAKLDRFLKEMKRDADAPRIIYSGEALGGLDQTGIARLKALLDRCARDVRIVYYIRHVADHAASRYGERVKRNGYRKDFGTYLPGYKMRFREAIENYRQAFGADALAIRLYDDEKDDLFRGFLAAAGIDGLAPGPVENVNRSLTRRELNIMRAINETAEGGDVLRHISRHLIFRRPETREPFRVTRDELADLESRYRADIDVINDRYLDGGQLLLHSQDIELVDNHAETLTETDKFYLDALRSVVAGMQELEKTKAAKAAAKIERIGGRGSLFSFLSRRKSK